VPQSPTGCKGADDVEVMRPSNPIRLRESCDLPGKPARASPVAATGNAKLPIGASRSEREARAEFALKS